MGKRKYKGRGRIDENGRMVIQKELITQLGVTEGTRFVQTLRDGGIFLEVDHGTCRLCYCEGEKMFKDFRICARCAREIIDAADSV